MAYRHPSGASSSLASAEFHAPSLAPFTCAFREGAVTDDDDGEFVRSFLEEVLLHLTEERWELVDEPMDLTADGTHDGDGTTTPSQQPQQQQSRNERFSVINVIIAQLDAILRHPALDRHFPVEISALDCLNCDVRLASLLLCYPTKYLPLIDDALQLFQQSMFECPSNSAQVASKAWTMKANIHARLHSLPLVEDRFWKRSLGSIHSADVSHLVTLGGTVIRTGTIRMVETSREYECNKCQHRFLVWSDLDQGHSLTLPDNCPAPGRKRCRSGAFELVAGSSRARDYQRIKIQDAVMKLALGALPKSIYVTLHDDLVDRCHAGDEVEIVGVIRRHWTAPLYRESHCHCELYLDAVHVGIKHDRRLKNEAGASMSSLTDSFQSDFRKYWRDAALKGEELLSRNLIVTSFCPKLYGLFLVKLAVVLTIIGGVQHTSSSGTRVRGECHLLLVGDAGTGKSQLLKYAAKVSPRSILTTGMGTTSAGLTVATVKEPGGEWGLEAGALVLADGGVCCIDEFGCIRDHDRATIHEAMEQQTVSVAKAGLVCTLNTRTTVFGAMNPKGSYDHDADLSVNTALATPLLSRFDLVMLMLDKHNATWDEQVVNYIMDGLERPIEEDVMTMSREAFEAEAEERRTRDSQHPPTSHPHEGTQEMRAWELERLQAYIQYVRYNFFPILTPLAQRILTRYYQYQRAADSRSAARTTIRLLESLVRLTQSHARLMWRQRATGQDACMAVLVMESSLQSCSVASTRDGFALGSFAKVDDLDAADRTFPGTYSMLLAKLDLRVTDEEYAGELRADEENEREVIGDGDEFEEIRHARSERARLEQQAREEARQKHMAMMEEQASRPVSFSSFSDDRAPTFTPSAFATTPATSTHTITLPKPIGRMPALPTVSSPKVSPSRPTARRVPSPARPPPQPIQPAQPAAPFSRPHAPRPSIQPNLAISSTQAPYDPFAQAMLCTPIPALSSTQLQRGIGKDQEEQANSAASPSSIATRPVNTSGLPSRPAPTSSLAPPPKRARLGVAAPRAPAASTAAAAVVPSDDDDEDESILMIGMRATQRNVVRVKKEGQEDVEMQDAAPAAAYSSSRAGFAALVPGTPPKGTPPKPVVDPLQQLLNSGMSPQMAQSILANPLRAAAGPTAAPTEKTTHHSAVASPAHSNAPNSVNSPHSPIRPAASSRAQPAPTSPNAPTAATSATAPRSFAPHARPPVPTFHQGPPAPQSASPRTPISPIVSAPSAASSSRTARPAQPSTTTQAPVSHTSPHFSSNSTRSALPQLPPPPPITQTPPPEPMPLAPASIAPPPPVVRSKPLTLPLSQSLSLPNRGGSSILGGLARPFPPTSGPPPSPSLAQPTAPVLALAPVPLAHQPTSTAGAALMRLLAPRSS